MDEHKIAVVRRVRVVDCPYCGVETHTEYDPASGDAEEVCVNCDNVFGVEDEAAGQPRVKPVWGRVWGCPECPESYSWFDIYMQHDVAKSPFSPENWRIKCNCGCAFIPLDEEPEQPPGADRRG